MFPTGPDEKTYRKMTKDAKNGLLDIHCRTRDTTNSLVVVELMHAF
jgi:hypothetical protein